MHRITIVEAQRDFAGLVNRVYSEGIAIELQRGEKVVAYLTPAAPQSPLKVRDLNAFLQGLPKLEPGSTLDTCVRCQELTPAPPPGPPGPPAQTNENVL